MSTTPFQLRAIAALLTLGSLGMTLSLPGCGSANSDNGGKSEAGSPDAGKEAAATRDAAPDRTSDAPPIDATQDTLNTTYPAFKPPVPQLQIASATGTVMATPHVRPVYFPGEALGTEIDGLVGDYLASSAWTAATAEYGIGGATLLSAVMSTDAPAAALMDTDIQTWLASQLDGTHPEYGPVDATTLANEIFVLYYPASTTVTLDGATSCIDFGGYHEETSVGPNSVAYVVVPRCTPTAASMMLVTSYLLLSTSGDPWVVTSQAYYGYDLPHAVWDLVGGDPELPGACNSEFVALAGASVDAGGDAGDGGDGAVYVQRGWSNASIAAYHDPCVPKPDSSAYFASVPVMNDDISVTLNGSLIMTKGIEVSSGESEVVEVDLFSDGPTPGPWSVAAEVFPGTQPAGALTFKFDRTTGQNGDILHLTVTPHQSGGIPFVLTSTLGTKKSIWMGIVQQK
jgi:hypothetical protein